MAIAYRNPRVDAHFVERFVSHISVGAECWAWTGMRHRQGYGWIRSAPAVGGRMKLAHRLSWELFRGQIPRGMNVLHRCDNPPCVRPSHLFLGTQADNVTDMETKGRGRKAHGASHPSAKLTPEKVAEIRLRVAAGESKRSLSMEYGVARHTILSVVLRRIWAHVA